MRASAQTGDLRFGEVAKLQVEIVETRVAAAIGAGFITVTAIAIAQGNSESQTGGPDGYRPINNPRINTHISEQEYHNSLQPTLWVDAIQL